MPKLLPSRTKFRKVHKGRIRGSASRGNTVAFGEFGIQTLARGRMTSNQIEAARVAINRHLKRCLLYTSLSPRDRTRTRMPSSA